MHNNHAKLARRQDIRKSGAQVSPRKLPLRIRNQVYNLYIHTVYLVGCSACTNQITSLLAVEFW